MGALTALAFVFRAWELRDIPSHVDNDVALMGVFSSRLIREGSYRWIGPSGSMHLLAYDQFLAWGMRLFGDDRIGLVTPSVLFGTATVPLTHLLGRTMFRPRVGLVAAGLLAGSYTHIHFSRILFGADTAFAIVLMVLMLYRGLRTSSPIWLAGAGVVCGLDFVLYDSARVMPLIPLALFCWAARDPGALRRAWRGWAALAVGALVAFGPMTVFLATSFRQFVGRGNAVALWAPDVWAHQVNAYKTNSPMLVVLWQAANTFLTFYLTGDSSPHFGLRRPMVAATTAILFAVGVGLCLRRRGDVRPVLLLAWIVLTLVFGGVLTYDPPSWPHLNAVLPAVALVAALGADALVETWTRWAVPRRIAEAAVAATVVFTLATNWQMYDSQVRDNARPKIRVARYLEDLPSGYTVYMLAESFNPSEYAIRFFGQNVTIVPVRLATIVSTATEARAPCTFVLAGYQEVVTAITAVQPAARVETHYDPGGQPVFVSITLDA
jgi:hypothetical protein